jgi:hypothetical protein
MVVAEGKVQVAAVGGVAVLEEATAMEAALWREAVGNKATAAAAEGGAVSEEATAMAAAVGGVAVLEEATAMEAALWREAEEAMAVGNKATAAADLCMKTPVFRSRPSRFLSRLRQPVLRSHCRWQQYPAQSTLGRSMRRRMSRRHLHQKNQKVREIGNYK